MRRIATAIAAVLVLLLVVSQLALPPLAERAAAGRLTRDGGTADVSISALPALRLLFGHGDSLHVEGRGLRLPTDARNGGFDRLDKFGEVRIDLRDASAGPLSISRFVLKRPDGGEDYSTRLSGRTTAAKVAAFLGSRAGGPFGAVLGELAAGTALSGGAAAELPLNLTARVQTAGGERRVSEVQGAVAGIPAGPLMELVLDAVVRRL